MQKLHKMSLKEVEKKTDLLGSWDLRKNVAEFSGFSFCLIYSRRGAGEICKLEIPMEADTINPK